MRFTLWCTACSRSGQQQQVRLEAGSACAFRVTVAVWGSVAASAVGPHGGPAVSIPRLALGLEAASRESPVLGLTQPPEGRAPQPGGAAPVLPVCPLWGALEPPAKQLGAAVVPSRTRWAQEMQGAEMPRGTYRSSQPQAASIPLCNGGIIFVIGNIKAKNINGNQSGEIGENKPLSTLT